MDESASARPAADPNRLQVHSRKSPHASTARVFVAGTPGSGKTSYCSWLEREKGFLHLDLDKLERGDGTDVQLAFRDCLHHSAQRFLEVMAKVQQPIVIDWGFPADLLALVTCLNVNGFAIWWFDGDRAAARASFIRRDTVPMGAFDARMELIDEHLQQIQDLFDGNVIDTVSAGPTYLSPEHIYDRMFSGLRGNR